MPPPDKSLLTRKEKRAARASLRRQQFRKGLLQPPDRDLPPRFGYGPTKRLPFRPMTVKEYKLGMKETQDEIDQVYEDLYSDRSPWSMDR